MMAPTLMPANQNSNSPNELTEMRLVPVMSSMRKRLSSQVGTPGSQKLTTLAPATASKPTTMTQKYQYNQPTEKPAQSPRALRA